MNVLLLESLPWFLDRSGTPTRHADQQKPPTSLPVLDSGLNWNYRYPEDTVRERQLPNVPCGSGSDSSNARASLARSCRLDISMQVVSEPYHTVRSALKCTIVAAELPFQPQTASIWRLVGA